MSGKFKFRVNLTRKTAVRQEELQIFLTEFRSTFLVITNVPEKGFRENQNTHLVTKNISPENRDG